MNDFQKQVLKDYPGITINDFEYFTGAAESKVEAMGLPKEDCCINDIFIGANEELYHRRSYCLLNCGLKCLKSSDYKKRV